MKTRETGTLLKELRALLEKECLHAYVVPNHDAHMSEYLESRDKRLQFITKFTGSAGTAVISKKEALLWTDGRYFAQASEELDSNWTLMKMGLSSTPSEKVWLNQNLSPSSRIGIDPKLIIYQEWLDWTKEVSKNGHVLVPVEANLIDKLWIDKPVFNPKPIKPQPIEFSGVSTKVKLQNVLKKMEDKEVDALIINAMDEIAWLLNLRGSDISYNPVFFSYLIITKTSVHLFCELEAFNSDHNLNFDIPLEVHPYAEIYDYIKTKIVEDLDGFKKIWIPSMMNYYVYSILPAKRLLCECSPILLMKAVKNETEIKGMEQAHIRDAVALCRFYAWLEKEILTGKVTEISAATKLESFRQEEDLYRGLSFPTISSSGPHNTIIHYQPSPKTDRPLSLDELFLCDSGGQYMDGTTDVTRTVHFGNPTEFEKDCFTRVFKGQTALATAVFPKKLKGYYLDSIPRRALWDVGLNYLHGTSHGVGSYLHVHEGPIGISWHEMPDDPGLEENMILSNEPGYYHESSFGIRLENIVKVVPAETPHNFQNTGYLTFKTLTLVPIQLKMLNPELLTTKEIEYLNKYHETCRETVGSILKRKGYNTAYEWLLRETQPLG